MPITFQNVIDDHKFIYELMGKPITAPDGTSGLIFVLDPDAKENDLTELDKKRLTRMGATFGTIAENGNQFFFIPDNCVKWSCFDCSDMFSMSSRRGQVFLKYNNRLKSWTCPKCGCTTIAPRQDACIPWFDRLETGR